MIGYPITYKHLQRTCSVKVDEQFVYRTVFLLIIGVNVIGCKLFTGVNDSVSVVVTDDKLSPVSLTPVIKPYSRFLSIP